MGWTVGLRTINWETVSQWACSHETVGQWTVSRWTVGQWVVLLAKGLSVDRHSAKWHSAKWRGARLNHMLLLKWGLWRQTKQIPLSENAKANGRPLKLCWQLEASEVFLLHLGWTLLILALNKSARSFTLKYFPASKKSLRAWIWLKK